MSNATMTPKKMTRKNWAEQYANKYSKALKALAKK